MSFFRQFAYNYVLFYNILAEKWAQFAMPFEPENEDNAGSTYGCIYNEAGLSFEVVAPC